ncbi:hypothetical protein PIB30_020745 [Stylosanthes scabra]|uniref:Uncharacterized protein n=1 Tax=Stylosanthes scabra TaxID=79078 RepID=A0ABU6Z5F4_9FABA|nr:hypothetical protein [Stylosanthes scabra]
MAAPVKGGHHAAVERDKERDAASVIASHCRTSIVSRCRLVLSPSPRRASTSPLPRVVARRRRQPSIGCDLSLFLFHWSLPLSSSSFNLSDLWGRRSGMVFKWEALNLEEVKQEVARLTPNWHEEWVLRKKENRQKLLLDSNATNRPPSDAGCVATRHQKLSDSIWLLPTSRSNLGRWICKKDQRLWLVDPHSALDPV